MNHNTLLLLPLTGFLFACGTPKTIDDTALEDTAGETTDSGADTDDTSPPDSGTASPSDDPTGTQSDFLDEDCLDGAYSEVLPNPTADIQPLINGYSVNNYVDFIYEVLEVRYPIGAYILDGGYTSEGGFSGNCIDLFLHDKSTPSAVIGSLSTLVHECGHFWDISLASWSDSTYVYTDDLSYSCPQGNIVEYGGKTFARSLINNDAYAALHPPCANYTDQGCDSYAAIYLNGDPSNGEFESGDQGYSMLHEESVQYVNSLATGYAFDDQISYARSERDGILTFLWYTMRYLRMARLDYPETYLFLSENVCWREAILSLWGRSWLYLEHTKDMPALGIHDDFLMTLVSDSELLSEIQRLRDLQGCN